MKPLLAWIALTSADRCRNQSVQLVTNRKTELRVRCRLALTRCCNEGTISAKSFIAIAQDFPEDKYDYKLQSDARSFAQNLLLVAAVDYDLMSSVSGSKMGAKTNTILRETSTR
jgi:hypothetical protein